MISLGTLAVASSFPAFADKVNFNAEFLRATGGTGIDVSAFETGPVVLPGSYSVDVYRNGEWLGRQTLQFIQDLGQQSAKPCFNAALLLWLRVDMTKVALAPGTAESACIRLNEVLAGSTIAYDSGEQRLDIQIPQVLIAAGSRGYVDPALWSHGIPAAVLNYSLSHYSSHGNNGMDGSDTYLGINAGLNAGAWRLRHQGSFTRDRRGEQSYQSVQTYISRPIASWGAQFRAGDAFTGGRLFPSWGFRGVQLNTDERMVPQSQRGYAPIVRGIANSNARVRISQSGNVIYETTVPPGAFEISDLYPTGFGGDLTLEVLEADGRVFESRVPYGAVVNSLREGASRYQITAGTYRNRTLSDEPAFFQGTYEHGFSNFLTGYGGLIGARAYQAALAGVALNTNFGAFGADVTGAIADIDPDSRSRGHSIRLSYSKFLEPTDTNILLAAYRYSSSGYREFEEAVALRQLSRGDGGLPDYRGLRRNRLQLNVSQQFAPSYGSMYLSGSVEDYWDRGGRGTEFTAGYSNSYRLVNYSLSLGRRLDVLTRKWENQVTLNVSFPIGSNGHALYASTSVQHSSNGTSNVSQSVSGTVGERRALSYSLTASAQRSDYDHQAVASGNVNYVFPAATLNVNASAGGNTRQMGGGLTGGLVVYGGGIAFSPVQGDTYAIVDAPAGAGAHIQNLNGLRLDASGKALLSNLTPYEINTITVDPKGLPLGVSFQTTEQRVVPTEGAVLRVPFESQQMGRAAVLEARRADGTALPFGAQVLDSAGQTVGVVGQGSRVIANALAKDEGVLNVRWGGANDEHCQLAYRLSPAKIGEPIVVAPNLLCRPENDIKN
ncbi:fimbria/pilus outer membrane usher protein [Achromobacter marplatensis]